MIWKILLFIVVICGALCVASSGDPCCSHEINRISHCPDASDLDANDRISSLENLLREQAQILSFFDNLQNRTITTDDQKTSFLASLEDLIRRQAVLLSRFEDILKAKWCGMTKDEQYKFLASFKDLVDREVLLIASFDESIKANWHRFSNENRTKFLNSFEDLVRRKGDLFRSYEELYDIAYGGLTVNKSVDKAHVFREDSVTYTYTVRNWYNNNTTNFTLADDRLGVIASNVSLGPGKNIVFHKTAVLDKTTCNKATVHWKDLCGEQEASSFVVCVIVDAGGIEEPIQFEQFCNSGTVTGTGVVSVQTHIKDKKIALGYENAMSGDGDVDLRSSQAFSQAADKLQRDIPLLSSHDNSSLNFFEDTQIIYRGSTPLIGERSLVSKENDGGMGTELHEGFSVNEIEKDQTTFYGSTVNATCAQSIGTDIKGSFNGTFETAELWHKMFDKDINSHQRLTGEFEINKAVKLHERPIKKERFGCEGIDC